MIFKKPLKRFIKKTLVHSQLLHGAGRFVRNKIAILFYHSIQPESNSLWTLLGGSHSANNFEAQVRYIARNCTPITLDDVLSICRGETQAPRRAVAITFDDGYLDNHEIAAPILESYGVRASFYVTVGSVEADSPPWFCRLRQAFHNTKRTTWTNSYSQSVWHLSSEEARREAFRDAGRHFARLPAAEKEIMLPALERDLDVSRRPFQDRVIMNWEEIAALHRAGHIIGSHTMTHPNVAHISLKDARDELAQSKRILEGKLAAPCVHFSYPHPILQPHWNESTVSLCEELGYRTAVTCNPGPADPNARSLVLPRVAAPQDFDEFRWKIGMTFMGRSL